MKLPHMPFVEDDGGRKAAGFKGRTGDCVARAITIASGLPYQLVYDALNVGAKSERRTKREVRSGRTRKRSAATGIFTQRLWFKNQMRAWGFEWTPTMLIGQGCKVHLVKGELPMGRHVVHVSKHATAVIDGVVRDTFDPQRRTYWHEHGKPSRVSERCVYGYWTFQGRKHEKNSSA